MTPTNGQQTICSPVFLLETPDWLFPLLTRGHGVSMAVRGIKFRRSQQVHFFIARNRTPNPCGCPVCVAALVETLTEPTLRIAEEQFRLAGAQRAAGTKRASSAKPTFFRGLVKTVKELFEGRQS